MCEVLAALEGIFTGPYCLYKTSLILEVTGQHLAREFLRVAALLRCGLRQLSLQIAGDVYFH